MKWLKIEDHGKSDQHHGKIMEISWNFVEEGICPLLATIFMFHISALQNGIDLGVTHCKRGSRNTGITIKVEKGDFGYITSTGYPANYTTDWNEGHPCNVELQACSTCKIRLTFIELRFPDCVSQQTIIVQQIRRVCVPGCDHLRLFEVDRPYITSTRRNFFADSEGQTYDTISSGVVIQHCMTNTTAKDGKRFYVKYEVIDKIEKITGTVTSPDYSVVSGVIKSPNFPHGYALNGETFTYVIQNLDPYGHVQLVFDDWDLAEKSHIQVYDDLSGPTRATIYGHRKRPTIISNTNTLVLVFNVGLDKFVSSYSIGFKATYKFVSDDVWTEQPNTDCSETFTLKTGLVIEFVTARAELPQWYDCVWIVKRSTELPDIPDGTILRIAEINLGKGWAQDDVNSIEILNDVTSQGMVLSKYTSDNFTAGEVIYSYSDGLYIRLRGVFRNADKLRMVLTGVNNVTSSGCPKSTILCDNMWCVHKDLACDGIDHCGDNSDENPVLLCGLDEEDSFVEFDWTWSNQLQIVTDRKIHFTVPMTTETTCYGKFRCHDDSACIDTIQMCDGVPHCLDRSDESSCSRSVFHNSQTRTLPFPALLLLTISTVWYLPFVI